MTTSRITIIIFTSIFFCSCFGNSSKNTNNSYSFWEGSFAPGTYSASWTTCYVPEVGKVNERFTIYINEDQSFEIKQRSATSYSTDTKVYYGKIEKRVETYDGQRVVWYDLVGKTHDRWGDAWTILPNLEFSEGSTFTWQDHHPNLKCYLKRAE